MRKLAGILNKTGCVVIFINQLREKVGIVYGNPEVTTGGRALKFYATIRIDIRRAEAIKSGSDIIGNTVKIKVVKNKVAPPFKSCVVDMIYGHGISRDGEVLDLGEQEGFVQKTGNWYEIAGEKIGNGREAAKMYLHEHQDVENDISDKIRAKWKEEAAKAKDAQPSEEEVTTSSSPDDIDDGK